MSGDTTNQEEEITGGNGGFRCHGACVTRTGQEGDTKKVNQDACFAFDKYLTDDQSLFGAFDGHGPCGHLVSSFVKQQLPASLAQLSSSITNPAELLVEAFHQVREPPRRAAGTTRSPLQPQQCSMQIHPSQLPGPTPPLPLHPARPSP